jgi:hypothetical protein
LHAAYTAVQPFLIFKGGLMYGGLGGGGAASLASGAIVLPNTGGNTVLTVVAIASMSVGGAILLSTLARFVSKKAHKA